MTNTPVHIPRLPNTSPPIRYPSQDQPVHALLTSLSTGFIFLNMALVITLNFIKTLMAHLCLEKIKFKHRWFEGTFSLVPCSALHHLVSVCLTQFNSGLQLPLPCLLPTVHFSGIRDHSAFPQHTELPSLEGPACNRMLPAPALEQRSKFNINISTSRASPESPHALSALGGSGGIPPCHCRNTASG